MAQNETQGLEAWVERLGKQDLPVLASVLQELNRLTDDDDASANQLADVIMKDASLTAQVLRIANSVHCSRGASARFSTVSRAVVQVGFKGIRAICISVMVIDSLLGKDPSQELMVGLARAFHAAVQARSLAARFDEERKEDSFLAALMLHVGDLAFWSRGGKQAAACASRLGAGDVDAEQAALETIGTDFRSISLALAKRWGLGAVLENALMHPDAADPLVRSAVLGDEISRTAEKGWDSAQFRETLLRVCAFTGQPLVEAKKSMMAAAEEAAQVAQNLGAGRLSHLIPGSADAQGVRTASRGLRPNPQVQLDVLREMGAMIAAGTDFNTLFRMVLEGLHRGVGLERVAIALIDKEGRTLRVKYMLGDDTEAWREHFQFPCQRPDDNILSHCMHSRTCLLVRNRKLPEYRHLMTAECQRVIGKGQFLVAPIHAGSRNIGVFYADRGDTDATIDDTQFESFRYFSDQANQGLVRLAMMTKSNTAVRPAPGTARR
jgi:HD-like signal output (HDOD) protein